MNRPVYGRQVGTTRHYIAPYGRVIFPIVRRPPVVNLINWSDQIANMIFEETLKLIKSHKIVGWHFIQNMIILILYKYVMHSATSRYFIATRLFSSFNKYKEKSDLLDKIIA